MHFKLFSERKYEISIEKVNYIYIYHDSYDKYILKDD